MVTVRYSSSRGYILTIADLRRVLADISHGSRRWWIDDPVTLMRDSEKATFWLPLFHSCPTPGQMTDKLSFQAPVLLSSELRWKEDSALVCLNPGTIRPLMEGLYLENGRVLGDFLEDWYLFWNPLSAGLAGALQQIRSNRINLPRGV